MVKSQVKIGVLALQGDLAEHKDVLESLSVNCSLVKKTSELANLDGLIIPGGESTTIKKLIDRYGFESAIKDKINSGMSLWGTCAGLICIANKLTESDPVPMKLINAEVSRNWFGRQVDSFESNIKFTGIEKKIKAVFIRAPIVKAISENVKVLSTLDDGTIVAIQENKIMGTSFHPEITGSTKVHEYFIKITNG